MTNTLHGAPAGAHRTAGDVCVLGAGLIGGSLLRALGPERGFGWNRGSAGAGAARAAGFDVREDLTAVLAEAARRDALVVVGVPMPAVGAVLDEVARVAPRVALTDVVSVKAPVLRAVRERAPRARFVGGHPMAGTAHSGWAATDPGLFRGATWLVAVDDPEGGPEGAGPDPEVWTRVAALATECGSRVLTAGSEEHDRAVARVSHLPHVLAESLAARGAAGGGLALALAAGSFRDGTRVAGSAPDLVRAICEPNADALLGVLDECLAELAAARDALARGEGLGPLVDAGSAGRAAYERAHPVAPGDTEASEADTGGDTGPLLVNPGEPGWARAAVEAGRAGRAVTVG